MTPVVRLGLRLAGVGAPAGSGRFGGVRSAMVAVAAAVGTSLLLAVAAISRSELALNPSEFAGPGMKVLLASVVGVIAVPVLVLAATAGRLSASLRDRRLANLRLLGLSPARTRLVAAIETGAAAAVGAVLGVVVFLAARPALLAWHPAGREWTAATLRPSVVDYVLAVTLVPLAVVAVSSFPQRMGARDVMSTVRRADQFRPGGWRLLPLLAGVCLASYVIVSGSGPDPSYDQLAMVMFAGMIALGIGTVLAVPLFVRLVADLLVRRAGHPTLVIAGRRLQSQPAAMSRVVAGLLIGLFVVTGARALVVAFEDTPQYRQQSLIDYAGQVGWLTTTTAGASTLERRLAKVQGIGATASLARLGTSSCDLGPDFGPTNCLQALVGTCEELRVAVPLVTQCREDRAQWLTNPATGSVSGPFPTHLRWHALKNHTAKGFVASIASPRQVLMDAKSIELGSGIDQVFLPESLSGLGRNLPTTDAEVVVVAEPGRDVQDAVAQLGESDLVHGATYPGRSYYDFVSGLRALVWAIAAIILAVGLLSFAIAAIDRAISRREEVMSLQLVGVSPQILRRIQWLEAAIPLAGGTVLAIGLGLLAGASYLAYGDILEHLPWRQTLTLAAISVACSAIVAALTVIASNPRIRPELIRRE